MRATVVNVRREEADVYIGRPGKGQAGPWGNPYRLTADEQRGATIARYSAWLWARVQDGTIHLDDLAELHGKRLGCFCAPLPCHGDVLAAAAAWAHGVMHAG